jgi:hypothetical protein
MKINEYYDEKLFIKPLSDHLKCPICFNIMKDPVQCPTQGHTFCRYCVSIHLDRNETCPTCQEPLKIEKLIPNRVIRSMIEDAEVRCFTYEASGASEDDEVKTVKKRKGVVAESCDWVGKLNDAERHYNDECRFAKIICPHTGCDNIFQRNSLPAHIETCLHRLILCQWCNIRKKIDLLDAHLLTCHKRPVPCPNSCLDVNGAVLCFDSSEIGQHRSVCSMESIACKFGSVGCKVELMRKDMPLHEVDAGAHIGCLLEALQTAQAKINEQGQLIESLSSSMKLIFKVPISRLDAAMTSTSINISGHKFYLSLSPNPEKAQWHKLFLFLDVNELQNYPVNVESEIKLLSYSENHLPHPNKNFNYLYPKAVGCGYKCYIETSVLKNEDHVRDGHITLIATIRVIP